MGPELTEALCAWQSDFERAYDPIDGWPDAADLRRHLSQARWLWGLLQEALSDTIVYYHAWEIAVRNN